MGKTVFALETGQKRGSWWLPSVAYQPVNPEHGQGVYFQMNSIYLLFGFLTAELFFNRKFVFVRRNIKSEFFFLSVGVVLYSKKSRSWAESRGFKGASSPYGFTG